MESLLIIAMLLIGAAAGIWLSTKSPGWESKLREWISGKPQPERDKHLR